MNHDLDYIISIGDPHDTKGMSSWGGKFIQQFFAKYHKKPYDLFTYGNFDEGTLFHEHYQNKVFPRRKRFPYGSKLLDIDEPFIVEGHEQNLYCFINKEHYMSDIDTILWLEKSEMYCLIDYKTKSAFGYKYLKEATLENKLQLSLYCYLFTRNNILEVGEKRTNLMADKPPILKVVYINKNNIYQTKVFEVPYIKKEVEKMLNNKLLLETFSKEKIVRDYIKFAKPCLKGKRYGGYECPKYCDYEDECLIYWNAYISSLGYTTKFNQMEDVKTWVDHQTDAISIPKKKKSVNLDLGGLDKQQPLY